jgi:TolB protein
MGRAWTCALVALTGACTSAAPPDPPAVPSPTELVGLVVYSTDGPAGQDVFALRAEGGEPTRLTSDAADEFDPDLSPDGTQIVYRRNVRPDSDDADIWIMDVDGANQRNLTDSPEDANWAPVWLPDGRIAFSSVRGNSSRTPELWSMAADGSDLRRLAEGWCEYAAPSPDGSEFVCAASVGGRYDLVIVGASGERRPLMATPETEFGPSWSPDGEWISFSRDVDDRWQLLAVRPDGSDEREIAAEGAFSTWTPDGRLVWSGIAGIHVAGPDGTGEVTIDRPASFLSWGR